MRRWPILLACCLAASAVLAPGAYAADIDFGESSSRPDYYDAVVHIMESARAARPPRDVDDPPREGKRPEPMLDAAAPALSLPRARESLRRLMSTSDGTFRARLEKADRALTSAWRAFVGGVAQPRSSGTEHLRDTQDRLLDAVTALAPATGSADGRATDTRRLQAEIGAISGRISADVYGIVGRAGVSARTLRPITELRKRAADAEEEERYVAAAALYGASTTLSGGTIDFDIDQFEQNIRDGLEGQTIGYTYAITLFDTVHASDGVGDARIPPDPDPEAQAPNKEMFLASVSKTLTTVVLLRVLELNGLTPDDPIGPWLPPEWDVHVSVAAQSFRDFLTHESGFTQKGVDPDGDNTFAFLEEAVGDPVPANTSFAYNNANFGIFRVLVPRLAGFDFDAFPGYSDEELYGGFFVYAALNFFESVDVSVTCNASQPNPTIYYSVPHNDFNGLQAAPDYTFECGGYGFFASAEDVGPILADLSADDELITDQSVAWMREGQLGFFDPANGYFWGNGGMGLYHNHGGDWVSGIKGLDTCVMLFPNGVTATLLINSIGGNYGGVDLYQCTLLRDAFDNAWEPI